MRVSASSELSSLPLYCLFLVRRREVNSRANLNACCEPDNDRKEIEQ